MNEQPFSRGDRVKLKSGGPIMTVTMPKATGETQCVWFDVNLHQQIGFFPADALILTVTTMRDPGLSDDVKRSLL